MKECVSQSLPQQLCNQQRPDLTLLRRLRVRTARTRVTFLIFGVKIENHCVLLLRGKVLSLPQPGFRISSRNSAIDNASGRFIIREERAYKKRSRRGLAFERQLTRSMALADRRGLVLAEFIGYGWFRCFGGALFGKRRGRTLLTLHLLDALLHLFKSSFK
jgi:hypothetical protein